MLSITKRLACSRAVVWATAIATAAPPLPPTPLDPAGSNLPIDGIPRNGGGTYRGPGDTVPPGGTLPYIPVSVGLPTGVCVGPTIRGVQYRYVDWQLDPNNWVQGYAHVGEIRGRDLLNACTLSGGGIATLCMPVACCRKGIAEIIVYSAMPVAGQVVLQRISMNCALSTEVQIQVDCSVLAAGGYVTNDPRTALVVLVTCCRRTQSGDPETGYEDFGVSREIYSGELEPDFDDAPPPAPGIAPPLPTGEPLSSTTVTVGGEPYQLNGDGTIRRALPNGDTITMHPPLVVCNQQHCTTWNWRDGSWSVHVSAARQTR
ncbi:MAG: hypothetical protein JNG88_08745 [Phycisphaerales bacterium]|nr:hypothetical protein [Phycisphaerales bacterium]